MTKKILIIGLALFLGTATSFAQSADEIINKHIEALGGKEKLSNLKTMKMMASIEIAPNMKAPMTLYFVNNKSVRTELEIQGMKMIQVMDGDSGWYIQPFSGKKDPERMDAEMVRETKDETDLTGSLFDYKTKGHSVELIGKEDMEGTETYKFKVTKKSGDVEYVFLDGSSYLVLKETSKHKFKDKEVESETLYSNYKNVEGIMCPFYVENREVGKGQGQAMNIDAIEVNPKVDLAMFKMPAKGASETTTAPTEKK